MSGHTEILELLGDFYEAHAMRDYTSVENIISKLQDKLDSDSLSGEPFMKYFSDIYSGRSAYNTLVNVGDYPLESVVREILQNAFDSYYDCPDIKMTVNFKDDGYITFSYNEIGFTLEQLLYYLSVGRNNGDLMREGRFGVGAKSVFMNVISATMRSNEFLFRISNNHGVLKIEELNLKSPLFKGTELTIRVDLVQYERIYDNFTTMTQKRGKYINMLDLCFAFNRKKVMNVYKNEKEEPNRTLSIAVLKNGEPRLMYKVKHQPHEDFNLRTVRFYENGRSVIDFICHEYRGFVFLVPFAISNDRRVTVMQVLTEKYNFFSTYELTGLLRTSGSFLEEKLAAFFVSIPNKYVTNYRSGIRHDSEHEVTVKIEDGLIDLMRANREFFVLALVKNKKLGDVYYLRPQSYAFEFVRNFIFTGEFAKDLRHRFLEQITILFPTGRSVSYTELMTRAFVSHRENVTHTEHEDGTAQQLYIDQRMERMEEGLRDIPDRALCVKYTWHNQTKTEKHTVFCYRLYDGDQCFTVRTVEGMRLIDFNLAYHFMSVAKYRINLLTGGGDSLPSDTAVMQMLDILDEEYGNDYRIDTKYNGLVITHGTERIRVDISRATVEKINDLMVDLQSHISRFESYQAYSECVDVFVSAFTDGKSTYEFLYQIKEQGGTITLGQDINGKYRFCAYGKQFMIPTKMTHAEMLAIIGDVNLLFKHGLLVGRVFDTSISKLGFAFSPDDVFAALEGEVSTEQIRNVLDKIYVSDLHINRIVLTDRDNVICKICDNDELFSGGMGDLSEVDKIIALRASLKKTDFADIIEQAVTGDCVGRVRAYFFRAPGVLRVISDQMPYDCKPHMPITHGEFDYLRSAARKIASKANDPSYVNYFAKDVNHKIHGYGGKCSICDFESEIINGFGIRNFRVGSISGDKEVMFNFSLYLCASCQAKADGMVINRLTIGGMQPHIWAEEIKTANAIVPEFMCFSADVSLQVSHDLPGVDYNALLDNMTLMHVGHTSGTLTLFMAAKWVEDNL